MVMTNTLALIVQTSTPQSPQGINALLGPLMPMLLLFAMAYFLLIWPMRSKQKKLDALVKNIKPGDKVVVNPGILATVVAIDPDSLLVRIDEKAKMRVYRSAIAGLQATQADDNKEKQ
jgi:preprotein translocase subunit YajC